MRGKHLRAPATRHGNTNGPWWNQGPFEIRILSDFLVGESAAVVLEDEADRREHQGHEADQDHPPADAKPSAVNAAATPTNSGHQLCGLKKPISPVPWRPPPSVSSSGRSGSRRPVNRM